MTGGSFWFYFQKTRAFIEDDNPISLYLFARILKSSYSCYPSEKVVIVEEGLGGIESHSSQ